jgi:hypothetical protein
MNAAVAKPIPQVLVYSSRCVDPDQTRAAAQGPFCHDDSATIGAIEVKQLNCCVASC